VPGFINFDGTHFDVSTIASNQYTVTLPNHASYLLDEKAKVYVNDVQVGSVAAHLNFSTEFTATYDAGTLRHDIALASSGSTFIPTPNSKKWGSVQGGQIDLNGAFGDGLFNLPYTATSGATVSGNNDNTNGHARRYTMDGADNDTLEVATDFSLTQLSYNPHLYGKIALPTLDDCRFMLGFNSTDIPAGDNVYLANQSGFLIGFQYDTAETEDTQWQIIRNDGDASQDKVSTGLNLSSTTPFTFELVGDTANNRWGWNVNGGSFTYYTQGTSGETPATNTNLRFTFRIEQIGDSSVIVNDIYYLYLVQDK
jgi:hypothetical protein